MATVAVCDTREFKPEIPLCLGPLQTNRIPLSESFSVAKRTDAQLGIIDKATGEEVARYDHEGGRLTLYLDLSKPPALVAKYVNDCGLQRPLHEALRDAEADYKDACNVATELSTRLACMAEISCFVRKQ